MTIAKRADIVEQLRADVEAWASTYAKLLSDERDMQVQLAMELTRRGWTVHTEYRVPLPELTERPGLAHKATKGNPRYPWDNDISVDIAAERNGEFAAIELKYATKPIKNAETIFNEALKDKNSQILKDQGAADIVMYNYWKDVRRIEALTSGFAALKGGVALIITNNRTFIKKPDGAPSYIEYATFESNAVGPGLLKWGNKAATIKESHPDMELANRYPCHWKPTAMPFESKSKPAEKFQYMISTINNL